MGNLIKDGALAADTFTIVGPDDAIPAEGDVIVSLERLREEGEQLQQRSGRLGVLLASDQSAADLDDHLHGLDLVAIDFPVFGDGRGYSHARILREQLDYRGPLRAVGQILHDQLFFMQRCGFDEFDLDESHDPKKAIERAFQTYSVVYQTAADDREPKLGVR